MSVHLHTICWNEADILPFFFRHYDSWVDRYFIHDNGSTDDSVAILEAHPKVSVHTLEIVDRDSFVRSHQTFHNEAWKRSRGMADWVIITALDEHLQANGWDNRDYLSKARRQGVTLIPAIGFQMVSEEFPGPDEHLVSCRTVGAPWNKMNKLSIFCPDAIAETGFREGRHMARPTGRLSLPDRDEMMLLHYKYMGFDRTLRRHQEQAGGLGETDRARNWGAKYSWSAEALRADWDAFRERAVDVGAPGFEPWRVTPPSERWWRSDRFEDAPPAR